MLSQLVIDDFKVAVRPGVNPVTGVCQNILSYLDFQLLLDHERLPESPRAHERMIAAHHRPRRRKYSAVCSAQTTCGGHYAGPFQRT